MTVDLVVRGGTVVSLNDSAPAEQLDIHVDSGRVVALGGDDRRARRVLDARGMIVIPGMHDVHDHLRGLTPGLSIGQGLKLDAMLQKAWRLNELEGPDEYRVGAALATARLLKGGVTSVVDHIYPFHRPGLAEAAVAGYDSTGIRWFMARGIMTRPYRPICESAGDAFRAIEEMVDTLVPRDRLFIAPVSFRQATASVYERSRRVADRLGLRLYTHIAETDAEVAQCREQHGARPVELLHRLGFGGSDTILVHCVKLSAAEIRILARAGTHVVHCPNNHMKLAKGVTRVPALLAAGVNVALGVDGMDDMLSEVRQEVLLQSLANSDPAIISPRTALELATIGGAAALDLGSDLGTIEVGKRADLVCLDTAASGPVIDPVWTVVNRVHGRDVAHVVVDGDVVVEDHRLTLVDEADLVEEATEVAAAFLRRAGITDQSVLELARPGDLLSGVG
jgi:5-methylthioadenosine/S-adenosylhomocysteine deaminase